MARIVNSQPAGATSEAEIVAFEKYIGHPLPAEYRSFLLEHNGGHPEPEAFLIDTGFGDEEDVVMCFFPLRPLSVGKVVVKDFDDLHVWPLHCAWDDLQNDKKGLYREVKFAEELLPMGTDGNGNYFCVVLDGKRTGAIVFFDHETAESHLLGDSLGAFLETLRPSEEYEEEEE